MMARHKIGRPIEIRLPEKHIRQLEAYAEAKQISRAAFARKLILKALTLYEAEIFPLN